MSNDIKYGDISEFVTADNKRIIKESNPERQSKLRVNANTRLLERMDSVDQAKAQLLAHSLEGEFGQALKEEHAPLTALASFPIYTRIAPTETEYRVYRKKHYGSVRYHRDSNIEIPTVSTMQESDLRPVKHAITSIPLNEFDQRAASFAAESLRAELTEAAMEAMDQFINEKTFLGDSQNNVYGIVNYPWLPKATSSVPLESTTAPESMYNELHRLANLSAEKSFNRNSPNTMGMPLKQYHALTQTLYSVDSGKSVMEMFLEKNPHISSIVIMDELRGLGPMGEDCIFMYRANDVNSVAIVIPQAPTMLPMKEVGLFDYVIPVYMSHGGVIMRNVLNNLLVYTPAV